MTPAHVLELTAPIEGWLHSVTAHLTVDLLEEQRGEAGDQPLLEIGVYAGKYFTLLLREAQACGTSVLGVDTFQFIPREKVTAELRRFFPEVPFELFHGKSSDLTPAEYVGLLGGFPRFISVDGSHAAPDVLDDLRLCREVLSDEGIVAADDFLNPITLGVNEAVARFMMEGGGAHLTPFFYCGNKLFLCRPGYRDTYAAIAERLARTHSAKYPEFARFVELEATWRGAVEMDYFGAKVLTVP